MPLGLAALTCLMLLTAIGPTQAAGPTFRPDTTMRGDSLTGWRTLGGRAWRAAAGTWTATPAGATPAWLLLDMPLQDAGVYLTYRCQADCEAGLLLRATRTPRGTAGVLLVISGVEPGAYRVLIDDEGRTVERERLRAMNGMPRVAPPPAPAALPPAGGGRAGGAAAAPPAPAAVAQASALMSRPSATPNPAGWNRLEVFIDANVVRWFINDAAVIGAVTDEGSGGFGAIGLYAGGNGPVEFREVAYKDLSLKTSVPETVGPRFRMSRLNDFYYSWSAAVADFNRDGVLDVANGPYVYYGPAFTTSREVYIGQTFNPSTDYPYPPSRPAASRMPDSAWVVHAADFTGDGWPDILTTDHASGTGAVLYVNPKGEPRRWDRHTVVPLVQTEITLVADVDGDGRPDLVYGAESFVRYASPDPARPTEPWTVRTVSERTSWGPLGTGGGHGLGVGDINGDGRMDIANPWGWWEQPVAGGNTGGSTGGSTSGTAGTWAYHPVAFGRWDRSLPGGATMAIYDVNGDGRNDIVTSLQAHGYGLAWFEQQRGADGTIRFTRHMIMDDFSTTNAGGVTFSELHGSAVADVDGDGILDFVVGKRAWAHLDSYYDPDPYSPAVLYVYRTVRDRRAPGGAAFVPELVHNRSGVGSNVVAQDVNGDGAVDIVTATNRGTFVFHGTPRGRRPRAPR
jgi:hypothetical protein